MNIDLIPKANELIKAYTDRNNRIIVSYGGSRSGKTYSILQMLILIGHKHKKDIKILAESFPVLRRGLLKDFIDILGDAFIPANYNKSNSIYTLSNGTTYEFISAADPHKFRGMASDIVFMDEITNIKYEAYKQIIMRMNDKMIVSFNPSHEFWILDEMKRDDCSVIHSTYKDNPYLPQSIISEFNQRAERDEHFRKIYVEGQWGTLEGLIFTEDKNYFIVPKLPVIKSINITTVYGMDFGFTNDPTTLIEMQYIETPLGERNAIYLTEQLYKTGLYPRDIHIVLKEKNPKNILTIADNARPEIISELDKLYKHKIKGVKKPKIVESLNLLFDIDIYINHESLNLIDEFRNYSWKTTKTGEPLNEPNDNFNHCIDAVRYAYTKVKSTGNREPRVIQI